MKNQQTLEVNPVDLIAIEAFRLFEPSFYERMPQNRALLVGGPTRHFFAREEDERQERLDSLEAVLRIVPDERRDRVREIVRNLFPAFFGHQHPSSDSLLRDLRIGHEAIFDRYFTLSLMDEEVSQNELDALLRNIQDSPKFAALCGALARAGKLDTGFERLDVYKDSLLETAFPAAITTLTDIGDSLPYYERFEVFEFKFEPLFYAWRLIYFSIKRIGDEQKRFELLRDGIQASRGVRMTIELVSHEERVPDRAEHEFVISKEHCDELKPLALERLRDAAADGHLRDMPGLQRLLWRWRDWGGDSEVRKWLNDCLRQPADALWLLRIFLSVVRSEGQRVEVIRFIDLKTLGMFVDIDRVQELTRDLDIGALNKEDHRALRAFRQALIWKSQGKPDGYYGDHGRTDNPLAEES